MSQIGTKSRQNWLWLSVKAWIIFYNLDRTIHAFTVDTIYFQDSNTFNRKNAFKSKVFMSHFSLEVFGSVFYGFINYSFKMSITTLQYNGITNNEFQWSIRLKIQLFPKTGNSKKCGAHKKTIPSRSLPWFTRIFLSTADVALARNMLWLH